MQISVFYCKVFWEKRMELKNYVKLFTVLQEREKTGKLSEINKNLK